MNSGITASSQRPFMSAFLVRVVMARRGLMRSAREVEPNRVATGLHCSRRNLPCTLRALIQAAIHRRPRGARPAAVAYPRLAHPRVRDGDAHRHVTTERGIGLLPEFREAEAGRALLALHNGEQFRRSLRQP